MLINYKIIKLNVIFIFFSAKHDVLNVDFNVLEPKQSIARLNKISNIFNGENHNLSILTVFNNIW